MVDVRRPGACWAFVVSVTVFLLVVGCSVFAVILAGTVKDVFFVALDASILGETVVGCGVSLLRVLLLPYSRMATSRVLSHCWPLSAPTRSTMRGVVPKDVGANVNDLAAAYHSVCELVA